MRDLSGEHRGYQFFETRERARQFKEAEGGSTGDDWFVKRNSPIEDFVVHLHDRKGLVAALNALASHPDNG